MMMRLKLVVVFVVLIGICALASSANAMTRWAALSMIESGDDDQAVGSLGEVSRFQIRPSLWPGGDPVDSNRALGVAQKIMQDRVAKFERTHGRAPTDFEFYVLWNAPQEINHPRPAVAERAQRFANLVQDSRARFVTR